MKLSKLIPTGLFSVCLALSLFACGSDDTADATTTDTQTDGDGDGDSESGSETGPSSDVDCAVFCVGYLEICVANGLSDEFPDNDSCNAACEMWDQDGKNCRYDQVSTAMCDQAGNTGTACP